MTFAREKDGERRTRSDQQAGTDSISTSSSSNRPRKKRVDSPEVGSALRSVYQRTIDEDIPSDLLDLLGKLG